MRDITDVRRGPKAGLALSTSLFVIGLTIALGATAAGAAPKAGGTTTTTAPAPTTTVPPAPPATTVAKKATTTTTAPKAAAPTTTVPKATTTTTAKAPTTTTTPAAKSSSSATLSAKSTIGGTGTTATAPGATVASTKVAAVNYGASMLGVRSIKSAKAALAAGACGTSPMGPIMNGQTITASGPVSLTTPVILTNCSNVTFNGGTWNDPNVSPGIAYGGGAGKGRPAFDIIGGSNITLENLNVNGVNRGGYRPTMAFNGGIESQGTSGLTISHVNVGHVFGDCLTLNPLRSGTGRNSIVSAVKNLTVTNFNGTACGRQGIAPVSVNGGTLTNITIGTTGFSSFDIEADQPAKEGARNLTVSNCSFSGLVSITAGGEATGPITFSNCTMAGAASGDVLMVKNTSGAPDAGPITFANDTLRCGASVYVSCFQLGGATNVAVQDSNVTIGYAHDTVYEPAYNLTGNSHVTFANDVIKGFGHVGTAAAGSTATVTGGSWVGRACKGAVLCPGVGH
jgi:hypothetical protein